MKKNLVILLFLGLLAPGIKVFSQEQPVSLSLSMQQAIDYALEHNRSLTSAKLDYAVSQKEVMATVASGLPHINGSATLDDNLKLMTTLIPAEMFGGEAGTYIPVTFGTKLNSTYGVTASTAIFNAPYLVGIQMAKTASQISGTQVKRTETDVKESITTTYYNILIFKESLKTLEMNLKNINEVLESTKASYKVGMAEATDVDQMLSNLSFLNNSKLSNERTQELNYNSLRFQLGLAPGTQIIITDSLESIVNSIKVEDLLNPDFNIENNLDYQLMEGGVRVSELTLKLAKASVLPSLTGSVYYMQTGQGSKLNSMDWFPYSVAGLQLSIPIFGSGERSSKIQKAKISLMKAQNNKEMITESLMMQEKQLRYNLISSAEQYRSQKENTEIAGRVYESVHNKYNQGMVSSLELTMANDNYLAAQNAYLTAIRNLMLSKLAFDKLMNNIY
jgi:outer membrane protein